MKTYDIEMPLLARVFPFLLMAVFTVGVPTMILSTNGPKFLIVPLLAVLGWNWWVMLTLVYRIVLHPDGGLEWVALGRRVKMLPEDIREVRPERAGSMGFFIVRHTAGKLRFVNQITGFHEVVLHIKNRNPVVTIRGC